MTDTQPLESALASIDKAEIALQELDANCCVPGRSPRMASLADTLSVVRDGIEKLRETQDGSGDTLLNLEDAGAQIGSLQIGCCAPSRLPLYTEMLKELTAAQRSIKRTFDLAH